MISLFRKLRQRLIGQNKFTKYVPYAFGEILLVVIGILFALEINNWNQIKIDRKAEQQVLRQLLTEYESNLEQLNSKIYIRQQVLNSSLELLKYKKRPFSQINADSFNLHLSRTITRPTFDPVLGVSNELKSSGKLYLISNTELRTDITSFDSFLGEIHEEEQVILNHVENVFIPFIVQNFQIGQVMAQYIDDVSFTKNFTMVKSTNQINWKEYFESGDINTFLHDPDLEDHIAVMVNNTLYTNQQSEGVKQKMESTIKLIKSEIKP